MSNEREVSQRKKTRKGGKGGREIFPTALLSRATRALVSGKWVDSEGSKIDDNKVRSVNIIFAIADAGAEGWSGDCAPDFHRKGFK